jgi:hypothetical protein
VTLRHGTQDVHDAPAHVRDSETVRAVACGSSHHFSHIQSSPALHHHTQGFHNVPALITSDVTATQVLAMLLIAVLF